MNSKLILALLILSHIVADFILQTDEIAKKKEINNRYLILHGIFIAVTSILFLLHYLRVKLIFIILVLSILHIYMDSYKLKLENKKVELLFPLNKLNIIYRSIKKKLLEYPVLKLIYKIIKYKIFRKLINRFRIFVFDQLLHIIIIISFYPLLDNITLYNWAKNLNELIIEIFPFFNVLSLGNKDWYIIILIISGYVFLWTAGSIMVGLTLGHFKEFTNNSKEIKSIGFLYDNQKYIKRKKFITPGELIGKLERIVLLTLILNKIFIAIPIVFTVKSIARFNNFQNRDFADYYIIGTSISVLIAIFVGFILNLIITLEGYGGEVILYNIF